MQRNGHLGAALLAFAPVGFALTDAGAVGVAALGAVVAVTLAMVPDYDTRVPFVRHRGATHTLAFAGLVGLAAGVATGWLSVRAGGVPDGVDVYGLGIASLSLYAALVATLTMLSHLAADALTPSGVPLLWPLTDGRFSLGLVETDSMVANYGLLAAGTAATVAWAHPLLFGT